MSAFLERAFKGWDSIYLCDSQDFWPRLQALLAFQDPHENVITISDNWPWEHWPGALIPGGESSLRAALRQDPDCLLVTQAEGLGPMTLQASLTGHRVIGGFSLTPRQVLEELLSDAPGLGFSQARNLFFTTDGLYLYQPESDEFERVCEYANGIFRDLSEPVEPAAAPAPPPPPPLEAPVEWGAPSPLLPELELVLGPLARPCWAPIFEEGPPVGQFGGSPRLSAHEEWPLCGCCGQRLHLVCQLDLARLPQSRPLNAEGWLQLFYCTSDQCAPEEPAGPFSSNALARTLKEGETSNQTPPHADQFPQRNITDWVALTDYPGWEQRPPLDDRQRTAAYNLQEPAFLEHFCLNTSEEQDKAASYFRTHPGDKLLGWPAWSQAVRYPRCPECQEPMGSFFQINNDGHDSVAPGYNSCHGQIFAGDGNGHIFVCSKHPDHLAFNWDCG